MGALLLLILVLELLAGVTLGRTLAMRTSRPRTISALGVLAYATVCVASAALAVKYPGPAARYAPGSYPDQIRELVVAPTAWLWSAGPLVSALLVGALMTPRGAQRAPAPARWYAASVLYSCLFLPLWFAGTAFHTAHYGGAWL